jgi:hypothetical protein
MRAIAQETESSVAPEAVADRPHGLEQRLTPAILGGIGNRNLARMLAPAGGRPRDGGRPESRREVEAIRAPALARAVLARDTGGDASAQQTGGSATAKCRVANFFVKSRDWSVSWPWKHWYKGTTIRHPIKFRVVLAPGCKKEDCLIGQRRKGEVQEAGRVTDSFPNWTPDGGIGQPYWWDGKDWYGGSGSWDWTGDDAADFRDGPGFNDVPLADYPLYWGGVGKSGCFEFDTYIADKATGADVSNIKWGIEIDYSAPEAGHHKKC